VPAAAAIAATPNVAVTFVTAVLGMADRGCN